MREDYDDSLEGPIFDEQTGAPLNVRPLCPLSRHPNGAERFTQPKVV